MRPNVKRLFSILSSVLLMIYFIQCTTVSEDSTTASSQPSRVVKSIKEWKDPVTGMEFVWVPKGCYEMGCGSWTKNCLKDELPVHEV